jgi:AraC-like DNA-binding protein
MHPHVFTWPNRGLARIERAGHWPLDDRGFEHGYCCPTHALHIYEYSAQVRLGDREIAVRPGDATLTPAGIESRYDLPRPGRHWCIHFFPVPADGPAVDLPLHLPLGALRHRLVEGVRRIAALLATPETEARATAEAAAAATLLGMLLELATIRPDSDGRAAARPPTSRDALATAAAMIDDRLGEPLAVPALAEAVGLTQNYLARRFRERYGTTLQGYQLLRRIEHAQQLLGSTDIPVGRIAERLGFSDAQHFNKQFRRLVGTNPTGFRAGGGR